MWVGVFVGVLVGVLVGVFVGVDVEVLVGVNVSVDVGVVVGASPINVNTLDDLPSYFRLGFEGATFWKTDFLALRGMAFCKPMLWKEQLAINPGVDSWLDQRRKHPYLAHLDLAQPSIVLSACACTVFASFLFSAFVYHQHRPGLKFRMLFDSVLDVCNQARP